MFTCEKCGKVFTEKRSTTRPQKTHADSSQTYSCGVCSKEFSSSDTRNRHEAAHNYSLTCGVCHLQTIFDRLEDEGINVPEEDRYYPYRATYDIEVMLQPTDKRRSEKLEWTSHHVSDTLYQTGDFR
jgi:hypothetical protein